MKGEEDDNASSADVVVPLPDAEALLALRALKGSVLNGFANTSVKASLIGGFALASMRGTYDFDSETDKALYLCNFFAVHLCTCSALTAAYLYHTVNGADPSDVPAWRAAHPYLPLLPLAKFFGGTGLYLIGVILWSWRDLEGVSGMQWGCLVFGVTSMLSAVGTILYIAVAGSVPRTAPAE
eukprot:TRINITY_DN13677_c0_g1_i1.p1 TRINITY_DN13677_c0_g1~~TRINITY_DN13677_c0_g1_i1.p1  ORF type:complete len:182 (+),score=45.80 TRINITY_DN13677_c0_g1_i1:55-600(+)